MRGWKIHRPSETRNNWIPRWKLAIISCEGQMNHPRTYDLYNLMNVYLPIMRGRNITSMKAMYAFRLPTQKPARKAKTKKSSQTLQYRWLNFKIIGIIRAKDQQQAYWSGTLLHTQFKNYCQLINSFDRFLPPSLSQPLSLHYCLD